MVMRMVASVTSGFVAPGVHVRSGRPFAVVQEFGSEMVPVGWATSAAAVVGVGLAAVGERSTATDAAPQLPAKAAMTITLAARDSGLCPFTAPPFPHEAYSRHLTRYWAAEERPPPAE